MKGVSEFLAEVISVHAREITETIILFSTQVKPAILVSLCNFPNSNRT